MHIRKATLQDVPTLSEFSLALAKEVGVSLSDEGKKNIVEGVTAPIKNESHGFFLVAENDQEIIGSLFVTKEWNTWLNGEWWFLYDVYTKPEFRNQGVLRTLFTAVEEIGKQDPLFKGIRLLVLQNNTVAKAAYQNLGMKNFSREVWEKPLIYS